MEIWHISQIAEVVVLSHKRCYKSKPRSIPEFQPRNGVILEGLATFCNIIPGICRKI